MVSRDLRLRTDRDVRTARSRGKSASHGPFVARIMPNQSDPPANRYAVVAGKKVGKSHERNRCKRLAREAIRHLHPRLRPGFDIVIIIRGGPDELTGLDVAENALLQIAERAQVLLPIPEPEPSPP